MLPLLQSTGNGEVVNAPCLLTLAEGVRDGHRPVPLDEGLPESVIHSNRLQRWRFQPAILRCLLPGCIATARCKHHRYDYQYCFSHQPLTSFLMALSLFITSLAPRPK